MRKLISQQKGDKMCFILKQIKIAKDTTEI